MKEDLKTLETLSAGDAHYQSGMGLSVERHRLIEEVMTGDVGVKTVDMTGDDSKQRPFEDTLLTDTIPTRILPVELPLSMLRRQRKRSLLSITQTNVSIDSRPI